MSHDIHHSKKVILIHHNDCGAYKESYKFENADEEEQKQIKDMLKVEKIINKVFPDMKVEKIWAKIGNNITFEKI